MKGPCVSDGDIWPTLYQFCCVLIDRKQQENVTWQVGTAKENTTAKLRATVARDLTARVRSKQLSY